MKHSRYNLVESFEDNYILYNMLKSTCVILDKETYERFITFRVDQDDLCNFLRLGMYIDDSYDELDEIFYQNRIVDQNSNTQNFRVYTTTACNAKCSYCFEKGCKVESMDEEVISKTADFLLEHQTKDNINIMWFGGEPLLNTKAIDVICDRIKPKLEEKGVKLNSSIASNGYLFTEILIKKAVSRWNLETAQITLDGLKDTYEKVKAFKQKDTFERVITNIHMLLENNISVSIRINYDENNYLEILELIEFLSKEFNQYKCKKLRVYASKITSEKNNDNSKKGSSKYDIRIFEKLVECGFVKDIIDTIRKTVIPCIAGGLDNYMILPNGELIKCAYAQVNRDIVGNINGELDNCKIARWCSGRLDKKCTECKILPLCYGGCLFQKFAGMNGCFESENTIRFKLLLFLEEYLIIAAQDRKEEIVVKK